MARIEIVIEDAEENGEDGVTVRIESTDPPIPLKDGTIDAEAATKSQILAFTLLMGAVGVTETNLMIKTEEPNGEPTD